MSDGRYDKSLELLDALGAIDDIAEARVENDSRLGVRVRNHVVHAVDIVDDALFAIEQASAYQDVRRVQVLRGQLDAAQLLLAAALETVGSELS